MELSDSITHPANALQVICEKIRGSQLIAIVVNPDKTTIRLDWQVPSDSNLPFANQILRLVITGQPDLYYLSYNEIAENRRPVLEPEKIISKNFIVQGATVKDQCSINLYGHAPDQLEAGEVCLSFAHFQLYDEQFGRISPATL